jgi:hypothetical protein
LRLGVTVMTSATGLLFQRRFPAAQFFTSNPQPTPYPTPLGLVGFY